MAITPSSQFSVSVATTALLDSSVLADIDVNSEQFKELLVQLGYYLNDMALVVNAKETGMYPLMEYACSNAIFPNPAYTQGSQLSQENRTVFRTTLNFGALGNTATVSQPHNITVNAGLVWTRIEAVATDTTGLTGLPIPYASPVLPNNISIDVDATNVNITTGSNRTNYNICLVYLEYVQF